MNEQNDKAPISKNVPTAVAGPGNQNEQTASEHAEGPTASGEGQVGKSAEFERDRKNDTIQSDRDETLTR